MLQDLVDLAPEAREAALRELARKEPHRVVVLRRRLQLLDEALPSADHAEDDGDAADATAPRTFGRFQLVRHLGNGMSEVYEAIDGHTGEHVVLKILRHAPLLERTTAGSFAREVMAAARLQHPCIGTVKECGEHDGVPFLVRPFVPGITLAEWIRQRQQRGQALSGADIELVLGWLEEILLALHTAHEAGLVHRDVKPSNILLPFQGRPQLLDFGLCREPGTPDPANTPTPAVGTLAYMAPEALTPHAGPAGPAADIYSAGATLFEALALRLPFDEGNTQAQTRAVLLERAPDLAECMARAPRNLRRVLSAALAKNPAERYATAQAFADDLRRIREGHRVAPPRRSRWARLRAFARRPGWLPMLAIPVAAMVLAWFAVRPSFASDGDPDFEWVVLGDRVRQANQAAATLVPGTPAQVPMLEEWLRSRGEPLAAALPGLRSRVATLAARPPGGAFDAATMQTGLAALESFVAEPLGTLPVVRRRLAWARDARRITLDEPAEAWRAACAAIAADDRYDHLQLVPQLDLVPLGPDPASGLQEFYHPRSAWPGAAPVTRDAAGRLRVHDMMGLVFVLIPGGECLIGEQPFHVQAPRYDPAASIDARPQVVPLAPFFLSKYEMTRAQWERLVGSLPGGLALGSSRGGDPPIGYGHPVESVSAFECDAALAAVDLVLPTEAQWEWACGTGVATLWFFGNDPAALQRYANVDDRRFRAAHPGATAGFDFDDGFASLAPIGRYEANPFGLHDVMGNVAEWCRDDIVDYSTSVPEPGDGMRLQKRADGLRAIRGSRFDHGAPKTSTRLGELPAVRNTSLGLRPARPVHGAGR